jgi:hypothetical protein
MDMADIFAAGVTARKGQPAIVLNIVDDEYCPSCGSEGSPKVADADGTWWWKCFTDYANCKVGYWVPGTRRIERKLSPEAAAEADARIREQVRRQMENTRWISQGNCSRCIPKDEALPAGWTEGTGDWN